MSATKRKRKTISLETKLEIIRRYENSQSTAFIRKAMNLAESTVRSICDNKERIMKSAKAGVSKNAATSYYARSDIMEEMEKMLATWLDVQEQQRVQVSIQQSRAKAVEIFNRLKEKKEGKVKSFTASVGWFMDFKQRKDYHNMKKSEVASAEQEASEKFSKEFKKIIEEGGYVPEQIFKLDVIRLFWKRMPERTYISIAEKSRLGYKCRLTVLLGSNVTGDCKLKPVVIYLFTSPHALKGYTKELLPVHWYINPKRLNISAIFKKYSMSMVSELELYCTEKDLPFKILLMLNNKHLQPTLIQDLHPNIKVVSLPQDTASLHLMDQGVIKMFKAYYHRKCWNDLRKKADIDMAQLQTAAEANDVLSIVEMKKSIVNNYWKSFNERDALWFIRDAWAEVTESCINESWKKICPQYAKNFKGVSFDEHILKIQQECLEAAAYVGFNELKEDDFDTFFESHPEELTAEDIGELEEDNENVMEDSEKEQEEMETNLEDHEKEQAAMETNLEDNDKEQASMETKLLSELEYFFSKIREALDIIYHNDPNTERSGKTVRSVLAHLSDYETMLQEKRQKSRKMNSDFMLKDIETWQVNLDCFVEEKPSLLELQPGPSHTSYSSDTELSDVSDL